MSEKDNKPIEETSKTSRYLRTGRNYAKYGLQSFEPEPHPSRRLFLSILAALAVLAVLGVAIWWFGFKR